MLLAAGKLPYNQTIHSFLWKGLMVVMLERKVDNETGYTYPVRVNVYVSANKRGFL